MNTIDRFWNRVDKNGDLIKPVGSRCWHWISKNNNENPQINVGNRKIMSAHKFIWEHLYGNVPDGKYVVKKCDNKLCVNPDHLFIGTLSDVRQKIVIGWDGKYKSCSRCKIFYPFTSEFFHRDSSHVTGLHGRCKHCGGEVNKETNARQWKRHLINQCKKSSEKKNFEFNLTEQDIQDLFDEQNGRCYWFGVRLLMSKEPRNPSKPSIDRLDRHNGYTKDNVVLCCQLANVGRNAGEILTFIDFLNILPENLKFAVWRSDNKWERK